MIKFLLKKNFCIKKTKSIYSTKENINLNGNIDPIIREILQYGYPESGFLRLKSNENIPISMISQLKESFKSLKYTAAKNNLYSLSFPQIKERANAFCLYNDQSKNEFINRDERKKLNPENYEVIINPRIISESKISHYDYEFCSSFKIMKSKVKRPLAIIVGYFDENGKAQKKELFDFEARIFFHEFDHLQGIPFIHWRVCEGEIEIISKEEFLNLEYTIEHYKNRLRDSRMNTPNIFDSFSQYSMVNIDYDNYIDEHLMIDHEFRNKRNVSYSDAMLIDIERAIKKDLKIKLKEDTIKSKKIQITENESNI